MPTVTAEHLPFHKKINFIQHAMFPVQETEYTVMED
jgi:hypothetical protein